MSAWTDAVLAQSPSWFYRCSDAGSSYPWDSADGYCEMRNLVTNTDTGFIESQGGAEWGTGIVNNPGSLVPADLTDEAVQFNTTTVEGHIGTGLFSGMDLAGGVLFAYKGDCSGTSNARSGILARGGSSSAGFWYIRAGGNGTDLQLSVNGVTYNTNVPIALIADDVAHLIGMTVSSTVVSLWVDGVEVWTDTRTTTGSAGLLDRWYLAGDVSSGDYTTGTYDEFIGWVGYTPPGSMMEDLYAAFMGTLTTVWVSFETAVYRLSAGVASPTVTYDTLTTDTSVSGARLREGLGMVEVIPPPITESDRPHNIRRRSLTMPTPTLVDGRPV